MYVPLVRGQIWDTEAEWSSTITTRKCASSDAEPKYWLVDYSEAEH